MPYPRLLNLAVALLCFTATAAAEDDLPYEVSFRAPWGAGPGELGRTTPSEGAPEGPMALALAADGELLILDQANLRVARFGLEGQSRGEIPLPADTYQDVAPDGRGGYVLLDRLGTRAVERRDGKGSLVARVGVEGDGVPRAGAVTALRVVPDGVWLEVEHARCVRVSDAGLQPPAARSVVDGRPTAGSSFRVRARRDGPRAVRVWTLDGKTGVLRADRRLTFDRRVDRLVALETTASGGVLLGAVLEAADSEVVQIRRLSADLAEVARGEAPEPNREAPWEQFRRFALDGEGRLWQLSLDDDGAEVRKWSL